jgi:anti-anti-sigma factor
VLEVVGEIPETGEIVVVAGLGAGSDWYRNLQAGPALAVEVGRERFVPAHRTLEPAEAAGVLAAYERRNRLVAPLVRLVLTRLLGWRYDGSEQARARLTATLPFVAFRPVAPAIAPGSQPSTARRPFSMSVSAVNEVTSLIELRGDLVGSVAQRALAELDTCLRRSSRTVLDLAGVENLDAAGLHALIVLSRIARARDARLRLANPAPTVRALLRRTGADRVLDVRTDVADALED